MTWRVRLGDSLDLIRQIPDNSIDAIVTDPPYGLGKLPPIADVVEAWLSGQPYQAKGRGFMGNTWDAFVPGPEMWRECFRVLKPGGHAFIFAAARTLDVMGLALRFAGFEIRDNLAWLFSSGFPKSANVSKLIDRVRDDSADVRNVCRFVRAAMDAKGYSSRDVAAFFGFHPRMVDHWAARDTDSQPTLPTLEQWDQLRTVLDLGDAMDLEVYRLNLRKGLPGDAWSDRIVVGASRDVRTNVCFSNFYDSTLIEYAETIGASEESRKWEGWGTALKPAYEPILMVRKPLEGTIAENVRKWGTGAINIDGGRIQTTGEDREKLEAGVEAIRARGGVIEGSWKNASDLSGANPASPLGRWPANVVLDQGAAEYLDRNTKPTNSIPFPANDASGDVLPLKQRTAGGYNERAAGVSRFFYVAKVSKRERDAGLYGDPVSAGDMTGGRGDDSAGLQSPRAGAGRTGGAVNHHPTLKPISLMRWLVRMAAPVGGVILDPFNGSGSTGCAAVSEGREYIGFEMNPEYVEISRGRISFYTGATDGDDNPRPANTNNAKQLELY